MRHRFDRRPAGSSCIGVQAADLRREPQAEDRYSPDGRWIAYTSDESGRDEVYLQRFPELGNKRSVSTDGGVQPVWSRDGEMLYYRGSRSIMSVAISSREPYQVGAPEALFPDDFVRGQGLAHTSYDVAPVGASFCCKLCR